MAKETYPKLAVASKIAKVISSPDGVGIRFVDFKLTPGQISQLVDWQQNKDELEITIRQVQGRLQMGEKDE